MGVGGSRLMRHDRFDALLESEGYAGAAAGGGAEAMARNAGIYRIHPSFRMVAVGEPPSASSAAWLTSELLACFTFHLAPPIEGDRLEAVLSELHSGVPKDELSALVRFAQVRCVTARILYFYSTLQRALLKTMHGS